MKLSLQHNQKAVSNILFSHIMWLYNQVSGFQWDRLLTLRHGSPRPPKHDPSGVPIQSYRTKRSVCSSSGSLSSSLHLVLFDMWSKRALMRTCAFLVVYFGGVMCQNEVHGRQDRRNSDYQGRDSTGANRLQSKTGQVMIKVIHSTILYV